MHIAAFTPTGSVVLDGETVTATGVPYTELHVPPLVGDNVHKLTAPVLVCLWSEAGNDPNPCIYVQVHDPDSVKRGTAELIWIWDDVEGRTAKWRVFGLMLPFLVFGGGVYKFGVYSHPDDEEALAWYPFEIILDAEPPH